MFKIANKSTKQPDRGFAWLRDEFPYQSLKCRILLYEYDAEALLIPGRGSEHALFSQATAFVNELIAQRQEKPAERRPLIFLCHGFGGLLVKRALALTLPANRAPKRFHLVYQSAYAIIFAGTPHHGICKNALTILCPEISTPPNQFVLDLLHGSEMLEEINDYFRPFITEIRIFNFWEQLKTEYGNFSTFIVDEDSAAPISYTLERCGIMSDHANLLNFSASNEAGFGLVSGALASCIEDSAHEIKSRWNATLKINEKSNTDPFGPREGHDIWQNTVTARTVHLGDVYQYNTVGTGGNPQETNRSSSHHGRGLRQTIDVTNENRLYKVERSSSPQFTGRQLQSAMLRDSLGLPADITGREKHRIAVIYGLGGSGKTQFCLRFAEQQRSKYVSWTLLECSR